MINFSLYISNSQLCIFDSSVQTPFNDWTEEHVKQGFSWRPGAVSFGTLEESGPIEVTVEIKEQINLRASTVRAIQVPFTVTENGGVEVATITDSKQLKINPGEYSLVFEVGLEEDHNMWCCFTFLTNPSKEAKILIADDELSPPERLL